MEETITQKILAERLGLDYQRLYHILRARQRPGRELAARLEAISGVDLRVWLFGDAEEIQRELEARYGRINFRRGRPRK